MCPIVKSRVKIKALLNQKRYENFFFSFSFRFEILCQESHANNHIFYLPIAGNDVLQTNFDFIKKINRECFPHAFSLLYI